MVELLSSRDNYKVWMVFISNTELLILSIFSLLSLSVIFFLKQPTIFALFVGRIIDCGNFKPPICERGMESFLESVLEGQTRKFQTFTTSEEGWWKRSERSWKSQDSTTRQDKRAKPRINDLTPSKCWLSWMKYRSSTIISSSQCMPFHRRKVWIKRSG